MRITWKKPGGRGVAFACAAGLLTVACSVQPQTEQAESSYDPLSAKQPPAPVVFAPKTKRVVIEIDYAPGAEPFEGSPETYDEPWNLFRDNANALLDGKVEVYLPERLWQMERLDDVDAKDFGREELVALAKKHRNVESGGDTVSFYVVFVNGRFKDAEGKVVNSTVGVSVRGTGIIAMFKPAITESFIDPALPILMEQTTLIHEFGHAIGLVDQGLPAITRHRDEAHGAHCDNPACIMYFRNDMVKEGVDFTSTFLTPNNGILFGAECLADAHALANESGGVFASLVAQSSPAMTTEPSSLIVDE